ncbi:PaaI family thioesterase [Spiractinospora alimapuensis]|uniref:PaaI family thioesterase n=1 Tax=Spiractinospora alimapuensis TaxID=2820884 RepID=UPI001F1AF2B0|nr:PaaI family thioesterase [Spiractinospora alimapuensis]
MTANVELEKDVMTVEAQAPKETLDPTEFGFDVIDNDDLPAELAGLVDQIRGLVAATVRTDVPSAELTAVGDLVHEATRRLNAQRRESGPLVRSEENGLVRFNTLGNGVTGPANPLAPPLRLSSVTDGVEGTVTLNDAYEGPPGCVHGGWVAALLDQAVGEAAWQTGSVVMTGRLEVDYRVPTPVNMPLEVAARIDSVEGRKIHVTGEIRANGQTTAETTAIMVRIWPPLES